MKKLKWFLVDVGSKKFLAVLVATFFVFNVASPIFANSNEFGSAPNGPEELTESKNISESVKASEIKEEGTIETRDEKVVIHVKGGEQKQAANIGKDENGNTYLIVKVEGEDGKNINICIPNSSGNIAGVGNGKLVANITFKASVLEGNEITTDQGETFFVVDNNDNADVQFVRGPNAFRAGEVVYTTVPVKVEPGKSPVNDTIKLANSIVPAQINDDGTVSVIDVNGDSYAVNLTEDQYNKIKDNGGSIEFYSTDVKVGEDSVISNDNVKGVIVNDPEESDFTKGVKFNIPRISDATKSLIDAYNDMLDATSKALTSEPFQAAINTFTDGGVTKGLYNLVVGIANEVTNADEWADVPEAIKKEFQDAVDDFYTKYDDFIAKANELLNNTAFVDAQENILGVATIEKDDQTIYCAKVKATVAGKEEEVFVEISKDNYDKYFENYDKGNIKSAKVNFKNDNTKVTIKRDDDGDYISIDDVENVEIELKSDNILNVNFADTNISVGKDNLVDVDGDGKNDHVKVQDVNGADVVVELTDDQIQIIENVDAIDEGAKCVVVLVDTTVEGTKDGDNTIVANDKVSEIKTPEGTTVFADKTIPVTVDDVQVLEDEEGNKEYIVEVTDAAGNTVYVELKEEQFNIINESENGATIELISKVVKSSKDEDGNVIIDNSQVAKVTSINSKPEEDAVDNNDKDKVVNNNVITGSGEYWVEEGTKGKNSRVITSEFTINGKKYRTVETTKWKKGKSSTYKYERYDEKGNLVGSVEQKIKYGKKTKTSDKKLKKGEKSKVVYDIKGGYRTENGTKYTILDNGSKKTVIKYKNGNTKRTLALKLQDAEGNKKTIKWLTKTNKKTGKKVQNKYVDGKKVRTVTTYTKTYKTKNGKTIKKGTVVKKSYKKDGKTVSKKITLKKNSEKSKTNKSKQTKQEAKKNNNTKNKNTTKKTTNSAKKSDTKKTKSSGKKASNNKKKK